MSKFEELGKAVVREETQAVAALESRITNDFSHACEHLLACQGRVVITGMGKSGHIGGKIAATLASTGTPSFFVHPGEASHGDLGMITTKDVVIAISNSGETHEVISILPLIKRLNVPLISVTGKKNSTLAHAASVNLDVSVEKEACPLGLAPTSSTTATLVMGDALAIALLDARGFSEEDFAMSHPGGSLGRKLLLHVDDIMHKGEGIPVISQHELLSKGLMEMSGKGLGMTAVVDEDDRLVGILTDGDLRRIFGKSINIHQVRMVDIMTPNPKIVKSGMLAAEAMQRMEQYKINGFFVVDDNETIRGAFNMHDLLQAGLV